MVQRCVDAVAGSERHHRDPARRVRRTFSPPTSTFRRTCPQAVAIGLHGTRRSLDVGVINGERFAVMAGAGFDARIMGGVDSAAKQRLRPPGVLRQRRVRAMKSGRRRMKIKVDGRAVVRRQGELRAVRERRHRYGRAPHLSRRPARRRLPRDRRGHRAGPDGLAARPGPNRLARPATSPRWSTSPMGGSSRCGSTARCRIDSTAARARRPASCASVSSRQLCGCVCQTATPRSRRCTDIQLCHPEPRRPRGLRPSDDREVRAGRLARERRRVSRSPVGSRCSS